jgi:GNAT superfamily N-acetyltransferase
MVNLLPIEFITGMMRENYTAVGFIPETTVEQQYIRQGRYLIQSDLRGRPVGYLLHGSPAAGQILSVAQAVVDYDFRNRGFGEMEVQRLIERAQLANCRSIKLRCADDLQSNLFWQSMGFEKVNTLHVSNTRQRAINVYMLPLWKSLFGWAA